MVDYAQTPTAPAERVLELGGMVRRIDWVLMAAVCALVGVGLWAIAGITQNDIPGDPNYYVVRQGVFAALGSAGFFVALLVDPDLYRRHWRTGYGSLIRLLLLVLAAGQVTRGAQRWVSIGFFRFQPSRVRQVLLLPAPAGLP